MKVSVLTIAYRPGYCDTLVDALLHQTLPTDEWQWILVDELWAQRAGPLKELVGGRLPLVHVPFEAVPYSNTAAAINLGLGQCFGQVVYFMADYMYPHPRCLERHWEIYDRWGPKVYVSGPVIDRLTAAGVSCAVVGPVQHIVKVGDIAIQYPEHMPPIEIPLTDGYDRPSPTNILSIFRQPFVPTWPRPLMPDARFSQRAGQSVAQDLYEGLKDEYRMWYAGRNDSAPLDVLRALGGLPEPPVKGHHGGMESDLESKMLASGCRCLLDREAPAWILPHPFRKPEAEFNQL